MGVLCRPVFVVLPGMAIMWRGPISRNAPGIGSRRIGRPPQPDAILRWCSDGFEVACDNGERIRIAFALDCCDGEAMSFVRGSAIRGATAASPHQHSSTLGRPELDRRHLM